MAPKIPTVIKCASAMSLNHELGLVIDGLGIVESEDTWDKISQALLRFTAITAGCAGDYPSELVATAKEQSRPIASAVNSERSRLSGTATDLLCALASHLQRSFEPLIPLYVPALLGLATRSNKVFISRASSCLKSIVDNVQSPLLVPFLRGAATDKSASLRLIATDLVFSCLNCYNPPDLENVRRAEDIEAIIRNTARDPNADVRRNSRKVFEAYKMLLPGRVDAFTGPLTPTMKKYLDVKPKLQATSAASKHRPIKSSSLATTSSAASVNATVVSTDHPRPAGHMKNSSTSSQQAHDSDSTRAPSRTSLRQGHASAAPDRALQTSQGTGSSIATSARSGTMPSSSAMSKAVHEHPQRSVSSSGPKRPPPGFLSKQDTVTAGRPPKRAPARLQQPPPFEPSKSIPLSRSAGSGAQRPVPSTVSMPTAPDSVTISSGVNGFMRIHKPHSAPVVDPASIPLPPEVNPEDLEDLVNNESEAKLNASTKDRREKRRAEIRATTTTEGDRVAEQQQEWKEKEQEQEKEREQEQEKAKQKELEAVSDREKEKEKDRQEVKQKELEAERERAKQRVLELKKEEDRARERERRRKEGEAASSAVEHAKSKKGSESDNERRRRRERRKEEDRPRKERKRNPPAQTLDPPEPGPKMVCDQKPVQHVSNHIEQETHATEKVEALQVVSADTEAKSKENNLKPEQPPARARGIKPLFIRKRGQSSQQEEDEETQNPESELALPQTPRGLEAPVSWIPSDVDIAASIPLPCTPPLPTPLRTSGKDYYNFDSQVAATPISKLLVSIRQGFSTEFSMIEEGEEEEEDTDCRAGDSGLLYHESRNVLNELTAAASEAHNAGMDIAELGVVLTSLDDEDAQGLEDNSDMSLLSESDMVSSNFNVPPRKHIKGFEGQRLAANDRFPLTPRVAN